MKVIKSAVLIIPVIILGILFVISSIFNIILDIFRTVKANTRIYTAEEYEESNKLDSPIDADMGYGNGWSRDK
jgi:hypothetical protein